VRPLAVTGAQPTPLFPNLPTIAASGLPGYAVVSINGLLAPARTPAAVIKRLNEEVVRYLGSAEARAQFENTGNDFVGSSPQEFAARIKGEMTQLGKVIKDAGISED
jgi:tripartite-type tricarboxylate transporter receptor subunit TctC